MEVIRYIQESIAILASGKCLAPSVSSSASGKGGVGGKTAVKETGKKEYVPIEETLDFYKLSFQSEHYMGLMSNSQIADNMVYYYYITGDYKNYLYTPVRLKGITAEAIKKTVKQYITDPPKYWGITANSKNIAKIKKSHKTYSANLKMAE